jgi:hypothetical protein
MLQRVVLSPLLLRRLFDQLKLSEVKECLAGIKYDVADVVSDKEEVHILVADDEQSDTIIQVADEDRAIAIRATGVCGRLSLLEF